MASDPEDESAEEGLDDEFDRKVGAMIDTDLCRQSADKLLATGSLTITRPGGTMTATLDLPSWRRPGALRVSLGSGGSFIPLGRRRLPPDYLRREVELQLAVMLAHLEN